MDRCHGTTWNFLFLVDETCKINCGILIKAYNVPPGSYMRVFTVLKVDIDIHRKSAVKKTIKTELSLKGVNEIWKTIA